MAFWGTPWGLTFPWGLGTTPGPAAYCALAQDRVLAQMDDTPGSRNFRDFICDVVHALGVYCDVATDVLEAFDVATASGVQLDMIGSLVGLPRKGFGDIRYRTFLDIQIRLLLSASREDAQWTGTHENVLQIVRTFVGPGPAVTLTNLPPYAFLLTVDGLVLAEVQLLANFVCRAIYAGVFGLMIVVLAPDSLWDSITVGPIADGGIWCSTSVAVAPCATWNTVVPIGSQPCE